MIKNFVANGCSFTEHVNHPNGVIKTWATWLAEELAVENHVNLANSGAGNNYIYQSTVSYLEQMRPDPAETLVIIMWSGPARIDVPISQSWFNYMTPQLNMVTQSANGSHWVSSGGASGSWRTTALGQKIFSHLYKISDPADLCLSSLRNFVLLEGYLKSRGYRFLFTSFVNYWTDQTPLNSLIRDESNMGYHCKNHPEFQNFDFSNWFFVNNAKDCIGEFARNDNSILDPHPTVSMHQKFAREIVLPRVQQIHM